MARIDYTDSTSIAEHAPCAMRSGEKKEFLSIAIHRVWRRITSTFRSIVNPPLFTLRHQSEMVVSMRWMRDGNEDIGLPLAQGRT